MKRGDSSHPRFADLRWAGFLPLNLMRSTKLSATTKLSAEHETPPIANVLLGAGKLARFKFSTVLLCLATREDCKLFFILLLLTLMFLLLLVQNENVLAMWAGFVCCRVVRFRFLVMSLGQY